MEEQGVLKGLVTVKDVLRFNATTEMTGSDEQWSTGDFEAVLEVMWNWGTGVTESAVDRWRSILRSQRGNRS